MGIAPGVIEPLLQHANGLLPQDVFDFLGVLMHVVGCDMRGVSEIEFPQSVIADDLAGALPALRGERCRTTVARQGHIVVTAERIELILGLFKVS
jgi:hypothetical protein